jgi:hypothetical protein
MCFFYPTIIQKEIIGSFEYFSTTFRKIEQKIFKITKPVFLIFGLKKKIDSNPYFFHPKIKHKDRISNLKKKFKSPNLSLLFF